MASLAFLGTGQMGLPMAQRLLAAGHQLSVWNRTRDKLDGVASRGARVATSPKDAAEGAELVFTMLASPEALRDVVLRADGVRAGLGPKALLVDMSTVGPDALKSLAKELPGRIVDAPVLGSVPQAQDGSLKIFVGGEKAQFERVAPVLQAMGSPRHVGPLGAGAGLKLVVNSTLGALMGALGEALALSDLLNLDQATVLDVLSDSPIGVTTKSKRALIESGRYEPRFKLALAVKDMRLVTETAKEHGKPLPLAEAAREKLEAAQQAGLGELDYGALVAHARGKPAK